MEKRYLLNIYDTCNIINLEFMEETMMDKKTQKIGVICSIVQIILSIICLIYSAINQENIIIWVLFLCSGILLLSSNISRNNKKRRRVRKCKFQLCAQLRVCSQAGGNPVYPRFSQPDNSESWDDVGNDI